jgi:type II secretory pathway pseudopilin PulG
MNKYFELGNDINLDTRCDVRRDTTSDFGGILASDTGVDLNDFETVSKFEGTKRFLTGLLTIPTAVSGSISDLPDNLSEAVFGDRTEIRQTINTAAENFHDGMATWAEQKGSQEEREVEQEAINASNRAYEEAGANSIDLPQTEVNETDENDKQETT